MRFEIGKAGIAAIALGTIVLSTCVFIFGVVVGWDIGSQSERSAAQMATAYPLQVPPAQPESSPSPAASISGRALNSTASSESVNANRVPPVARATNSETAHTVEANAEAVSRTPSPPIAASPPAGPTDGNASPPAQAAAVERPTFPRHRKPFNIQIEAAMDLNGANQLIKRLQQLGYPSHLMPTTISGQQWYKVEVGPYTTQEEAAAAEAQLRVKYNAAYGAGSRPAQPAASDSE
jgi:cell division septation protein DedD